MKKIILFMTMTCLFCLSGCASVTAVDLLSLPTSEGLTNITRAKQDVGFV